MKFMEYQAREVFEEYGIPVKKAVVIDSLENIDEQIKGLTFPLVVKAQVQIGGRGKAGGVQFAEDSDSLKAICAKMLHSVLKGHKVNKIMIVEKAEGISEMYLSIILDRLSKRPMIIFSSQGGVDIEETAVTNPEAIIKVPIYPEVGVQKYTVHYLINKSGIDKGLLEPLYDIISKLYKVFLAIDALIVEINPLLVCAENEIIALDGKVDVDDSALYRQPKVLEYRDSIQEEALVLEARKYKFLYIPVEEGGDVAVISNGSGMLMSCIDHITKAGMTVGAVLDLGGGATSDKIKEAVRIMLSNTDIKYLFINIFGGITRCNEVAEGVKIAMELQPKGKCVIVRLEGTNKEMGIEIIKSINYDVVSVDGLVEGVEELYKRRQQ
ncbi:ADP-forming succinate--CoA ligase subunit beta [Fusibacter ferrireducens]|uniref:ADP-forming succinate--CoA ligase subunit beta n=1 Tax=Fusibacter ferrireducens TaxID=2785058 RepID=A0ABR9ZXE1_9FIRM|nr:ADP-forming succinate--CoA ligase subunit beta [Fusibacter ferrireducens]MBF4695031.1 ADP-forming succinate--CoA ligase subunit beta [Fusibacter ferrireducens]